MVLSTKSIAPPGPHQASRTAVQVLSRAMMCATCDSHWGMLSKEKRLPCGAAPWHVARPFTGMGEVLVDVLAEVEVDVVVADDVVAVHPKAPLP